MQDLRPAVCDLGLYPTDRTPRILIGTEAQKVSPKRSDIAGSVALPVPLLTVLVGHRAPVTRSSVLTGTAER